MVADVVKGGLKFSAHWLCHSFSARAPLRVQGEGERVAGKRNVMRSCAQARGSASVRWCMWLTLVLLQLITLQLMRFHWSEILLLRAEKIGGQEEQRLIKVRLHALVFRVVDDITSAFVLTCSYWMMGGCMVQEATSMALACLRELEALPRLLEEAEDDTKSQAVKRWLVSWRHGPQSMSSYTRTWAQHSTCSLSLAAGHRRLPRQSGFQLERLRPLCPCRPLALPPPQGPHARA